MNKNLTKIQLTVLFITILITSTNTKYFSLLLSDGGSNLNSLVSHVYSSKSLNLWLIEHPDIGDQKLDFNELLFLDKNSVSKFMTRTINLASEITTNSFGHWKTSIKYSLNKNTVIVESNKSMNTIVPNDESDPAKANFYSFSEEKRVASHTAASHSLKLNGITHYFSQSLIFGHVIKCTNTPSISFTASTQLLGENDMKDMAHIYIAVACEKTDLKATNDLLDTSIDESESKSIATKLNKKYKGLNGVSLGVCVNCEEKEKGIIRESSNIFGTMVNYVAKKVDQIQDVVLTNIILYKIENNKKIFMESGHYKTSHTSDKDNVVIELYQNDVLIGTNSDRFRMTSEYYDHLYKLVEADMNSYVNYGSCYPKDVEIITRTDKFSIDEDTVNIQVRITCEEDKRAILV